MNPNFYSFWENMWFVVLILAVALVAGIIACIRYYKKNRKITAAVTVGEIREDLAVNPTMTTSRGVPLALAVSSMKVTFKFSNDGQVILNVPGTDAARLVRGMRGQLCYRGGSFISFVPEK